MFIQISINLSSYKKSEISCFLSGDDDDLDIYLEIHAGAGGTESQDWADMLRRMYLKWFDKKNFKYKIISEHKGEEAGIKSSAIKVDGNYLYGLMKSESEACTRLVRISPFDSGARRHTSFASVWVYPAVDDDIDIKLDEKDLRIDTYRSSGAGGQHVNTTDSAVRITSSNKIVVQCQNERSQHKNKETCYKMLKARLVEFEIQKRDEQNQKKNTKTDIGWGHQIRSYVLQPYQLVKDLRNKVENTNPSSVLDGNIDQFIEEGIKIR